MRKLIAELRRRQVFRAAAIYILGGWLFLQLVDVLREPFAVPDWTFRLIILLLIVGFGIAMVLAWLFDLTPQGVRRERPAPHDVVADGQGDDEPGVSAAVSSEDTRSVAVLPFANLSSDEESAFFSDGLTEELLDVLARIEDLRVSSRTSSFAFKNKDVPLTGVASRLGVAHVLEGSVRREGSRVRVSARLVAAASDTQLWSQRYDRELVNIFAIQDDIAKSVAGALEIQLRGASGAPLCEECTEVSAAYESYLKGRVLASRGTAVDSEGAARHFKSAVEMDPEYAGAWAGMALNLAQMGTYIGSMAPAEALSQSRDAAQRALALDDRLASPYLALGEFLLGHDWDIDRALEMFRRAVDLEPGKSEPHLYFGRCLANIGRFEESFAELGIALELDPLSSLARARLAMAHFYAHEYGKAEQDIAAVAELDPGYPIDFVRALVWQNQGRLEEALEAAAGCAIEWQRLDMLALISWDLGDKAGARSYRDELVDKCSDLAAVQISQLHCRMGEVETALDWLERAYRNHDAGLVQLKVMPFFEEIRDHERFRKVMRDVGHKD